MEIGVSELDDCLRERAARVDAAIASFLPQILTAERVKAYTDWECSEEDAAEFTAAIARPIWDLMMRRGKRWRPMVGLLLLEALGTPSEPYEVLLCCLAELPHTGALIIDDIEDDSTARRGEECIHLRYGRDVAINAANAAYFLPFVLIGEYPGLSDAQRLAIHEALSREFVRAHFGQSHDINWSGQQGREKLEAWASAGTAARIRGAYALKTGAAVAGPAAVACVIAGADARVRRVVVAFARAFGTAFQIVDDVLDYVDAEDRRKPLGKDIGEGKLTYVLCRALQTLQPTERSRLAEIVCSSSLHGDSAAQREAIGLVRASGVLEACREEAISMFERAWPCLAGHLVESEPTAVLRALCTRLILADHPT